MLFQLCSIFVIFSLRFATQAVAGEQLQQIRDVAAEVVRPIGNSNGPKLSLTISARKRFLEVSWTKAPAHNGDNVILTTQDPHSFEQRELPMGTPLATFQNVEGSGAGEDNADYIPHHGYTSTPASAQASSSKGAAQRLYWISNGGTNTIVAAIKPSLATQWFTTGVPFNYELSRNITAQTSCYGYWASYINAAGQILSKTCVRAYPRWMHELRANIGDLRLRDLFIPGTHDSGSYRVNFDPLVHERLVTKYTLTQDDDIRGQLLHGARYLDIRVGYYSTSPEKFFINHGITKQRPLQEIINQVKDFVLETNEIVIFGIKEFPVGFGKGLGVHRLLVSYLKEQFDNLIVHPSATWSASLRDIWTRQQNVILAYDKSAIVQEFPYMLFGAVEQRWGNVQTWPKLEEYLRNINGFDRGRFWIRPVADMAELTPLTWDVILDKPGGLRKMADSINWRISKLYRDELGQHANIVAADFIRGTTLMETAMDLNRRRTLD